MSKSITELGIRMVVGDNPFDITLEYYDKDSGKALYIQKIAE